MRLTLALLKRKLPRGHIYRGKYRIVKEPTALDAALLREDYAREDQNLFYLRHPYLSVEQSGGEATLRQKRYERIGGFIKEARLKFRPDVTIEQRLRHLRVTDAWD